MTSSRPRQGNRPMCSHKDPEGRQGPSPISSARGPCRSASGASLGTGGCAVQAVSTYKLAPPGPLPGQMSLWSEPITGGGRRGVRTCVPCSGGCLSRTSRQPPGSVTWPSSAGLTPELRKGRAAVILRRTTERQRRTESEVLDGAELRGLPLVPQAQPAPQRLSTPPGPACSG